MIVTELVKKTASLNSRDTYGQTALHIAAERGQLGIVQELLSVPYCDPNILDSFDRSPLMNAAQHGRLEIVKELVNTGAEVNVRDSNGRSALFIAARSDRLEMIKYLLHVGADPNVNDNDDEDILDALLANAPVTGSRLDLIKFFLAVGYKPAPEQLLECLSIPIYGRRVGCILLQATSIHEILPVAAKNNGQHPSRNKLYKKWILPLLQLLTCSTVLIVPRLGERSALQNLSIKLLMKLKQLLV